MANRTQTQAPPGKPMSWALIIAIMVADGLATGLALGIVSSVVELPQGIAAAGIGASVGVVGAALISRRRAQLAAQASAGA